MKFSVCKLKNLEVSTVHPTQRLSLMMSWNNMVSCEWPDCERFWEPRNGWITRKALRSPSLRVRSSSSLGLAT